MSAVLALLFLAASPAPVTSVTVFGDRARIVRTAIVSTDAQLVEFPLLHGAVDVSTIRVEAVGARVLRVDLENVPSSAFAGDAARKASAQASFYLFFSMLIGAFIASTAGAIGGRQRDL